MTSSGDKILYTMHTGFYVGSYFFWGGGDLHIMYVCTHAHVAHSKHACVFNDIINHTHACIQHVHRGFFQNNDEEGAMRGGGGQICM